MNSFLCTPRPPHPPLTHLAPPQFRSEWRMDHIMVNGVKWTVNHQYKHGQLAVRRRRGSWDGDAEWERNHDHKLFSEIGMW